MSFRDANTGGPELAGDAMDIHLPDDLFLKCLSPTDSSTPARLEQRIFESIGDRSLLPCHDLDLEEYERLGLCRRRLLDCPHPVATCGWGGEDDDRLQMGYEQAHWQVQWRESWLNIVRATWQTSCGGEVRHWVISPSREIAEAFALDVARKTNDPGESILVFHGGHWQRSRELYLATQQASFDDLVLSGSLKERIRADFGQFLHARERYESLQLAWRRGALFIGPPGNGKTHCVRALVKELEIPSLYVQSLSHNYYTSEQLLKEVFDRARQLRPCVLIFEDLDALVTQDNRSFFLNQLDGFEKNVGMLVIATTNHPERIDPAILDRPSRFDRKYHFGLPAAEEREAYFLLWQQRLWTETNWSVESVTSLVDQTGGFSFAYLKELVVSGLLRWMSHPHQEFAEILDSQCDELRAQMATAMNVGCMPVTAMATDVVGE